MSDPTSKKPPKENIAHLKNVLIPFSFFSLNSSRSEEPTNAPENELASGDIAKDTPMINSDTANNDQNSPNICTPLFNDTKKDIKK